MMIHFNKVTIIGVGLIGGSLAKVIKAQALAEEITGSGRSRKSLETALSLGVIDRIGGGLPEAVDGADLVVLSSPVGTFEKLVTEMAPHMKEGAIVTDVGSVKGKLVKVVQDALPRHVHYVPGHPIAGKEHSGVAEASDSLFQGARCILTPTKRTSEDALETVRSLWKAGGAEVLLMDPDLHDKIFGAVSHLPHVAAFALVSAVAELNTGSDDYITFSGAGFKDFTRIAASSPEMWRDICMMNRKNVLEMIDRYLFSLNRIKQAIRAREEEKVAEMFQSACDVRRRLS